MTQVCATCRHWQLETSPLRSVGFGQCAAITDPVKHAGQTFAPNAPCRIKRWERADDKAIARRAAEGATPR